MGSRRIFETGILTEMHHLAKNTSTVQLEIKILKAKLSVPLISQLFLHLIIMQQAT